MLDDHFEPWETYWNAKTMLNTKRGQFNTYSTSNTSDFVLLCVHGAGHSALSFSLLAHEVFSSCQVFAPDLKCHGETPGDPAVDLSIDNLVADVVALGRAVHRPGTRLLLIGHSLGGSVAVRAAQSLKPTACFVIDTIEGIALAALPRMQYILTSRPRSFATPRDAVRYVANSGEMSSAKSAAVSTAGRVIFRNGAWEWRTDLTPSEPHWNGWFRGFADIFIRAPTYKILILPDINRLDKPFLIGHMSGKFQLEIIHGTNHCMHEDAPQDIALIIKNFIERLMGAVPHW
jgi:protein phosphatase methylesterase 1